MATNDFPQRLIDPNDPLGINTRRTTGPTFSVPSLTERTNTTTTSVSPMDQYLQYLEGQKRPQALSDIASIFGSFSEGERAGRQGIPAALMQQDMVKLAAMQDQRSAETDAWKKLMSTSFLTGNNALPQSGPVTLRGRQIPVGQFSRGEIPEAARQGAESMQGMLLSRLKPGSGFQPTDISPYLKPTTGERIGNIGAITSGALGALDSLDVLRKIPGLSKIFGAGAAAAVPSVTGAVGAGTAATTAGTAAATGGLGAGLGAFFTNPWTIGIGAGLAAYPFIKKAFGPSAGYKEGDARGNFISQLGGGDYNAGMKPFQDAFNRGLISQAEINSVPTGDLANVQRILAKIQSGGRGPAAQTGAAY